MNGILNVNVEIVAISAGTATNGIAIGSSRAPILQPFWSQVSQYSAEYKPKLQTRWASSSLPAHCRMVTPVAKSTEKNRVIERLIWLFWGVFSVYLRLTLAFTHTLLLWKSFGRHSTYVDGLVRFLPVNGSPQWSFCTLSQCQHIRAIANIHKWQNKNLSKLFIFRVFKQLKFQIPCWNEMMPTKRIAKNLEHVIVDK